MRNHKDQQRGPYHREAPSKLWEDSRQQRSWHLHAREGPPPLQNRSSDSLSFSNQTVPLPNSAASSSFSFFPRSSDWRPPPAARMHASADGDKGGRQFQSASAPSSRRKEDCSCAGEPAAAAVSGSTTRSSSGGRCERGSWRYSISREFSENRAAAGELLLNEEVKGLPRAHAVKQTNTEKQQMEAADGIGSEAAAADIFKMTESEVRIYALQLQALTQVLLRNMSCLYTSARGEIERKDVRLAQQEKEIFSLKQYSNKQLIQGCHL
ncbi:hypothetical protein Efla_000123 [Eimeria flavescens]